MKQKKIQQQIRKKHTQSVQIHEGSKPDQSLPTQDEALPGSISTIAVSLAEDEQEVMASDGDDASSVQTEEKVGECDVTSSPTNVDEFDTVSLPTEDGIDGFDPPEIPEITAPLETAEVTPSLAIAERAFVARPIHRTSIKRLGIISTYILLIATVLLSFMLWRSTSITHLYTTTLDPHTGAIEARQEISSFPISTTLTAPTYTQSAVLLGMPDANMQDEQHVLMLQGDNTSWQLQKTVTVTYAPTSLSSAPDGSLLLEAPGGLQVLSAAGEPRWQLHSPQPARGAHPFQPASDGQMVFTLLATQPAQVAAYDLHSGAQRWTHVLNDSVDYAAPLLLDGHTLYIASDHMLYALSSDDGNILWARNFPARTLLLEHEDQVHLLLAAGAHGLVGLDPQTGINAWTFSGQPGDTTTPAQFYQATLGRPTSSTDQIVYTTGVIWQMPQVEEQVWLYAIDAAKGTLLWSQTIASGMVGTDAGRFFTPTLDAPQAIVVLQQQINRTTQRIEAFDLKNGQKRWSQLLTDISHAAPFLLVTANGSPVLFTTTSDLLTILQVPNIVLLLLFALVVLSSACLLLIFLLPFSRRKRWFANVARTWGNMARLQVKQLWSRLLLKLSRKLSRRQLALLLLLCVIVISIPGYFLLNQPQARTYQFATGTGAVQWQTGLSASVTALRADAQGSVVVASEGANQHQLQMLNRDGTVRWHTFNTEGTFFLPGEAAQPNTLLVALSGHTSFSYQIAPDDPSYPRVLDHLLTLYLLDRNTGAPLWQHTEVYPDDQQDATILGSDANYIYVASIQTNLPQGSTRSTVQLLGINQASGTIDWRVFGPALADSEVRDNGKLFLRGRQTIWQVAGTVYAIDTTVGQIAWRRSITTDPPALEMQEEGEMAQVGAFLLIARSGSVHGLDLASGNEIWTIASTGAGGISAIQTPTKIIVAAQTVLVGKQAQLYAFNGLSRQLLWDQRLSGPIQQLRASDDGKMLFAMTADQNNTFRLLALDTQTGAIRWQFAQAGPFTLFNADSDGFQYRSGHVLVSTCSPSQHACDQQHLYVLDAATGSTLWNVSGSNLDNIYISPDGTTVTFGITRSTWDDLLARL